MLLTLSQSLLRSLTSMTNFLPQLITVNCSNYINNNKHRRLTLPNTKLDITGIFYIKLYHHIYKSTSIKYEQENVSYIS